jgi:serpin B
MRISTVLSAGLIAIACLTRQAEGQTRAQSPALRGNAARALADSNNKFTWELYAQLRENSNDNLFFSPQSIAIALAMTWEGARGETAVQMSRVLHLGSPQSTTPDIYWRMLTQLNQSAGPAGQPVASRGYQLTIANGLFVQQGYNFLEPFLATLRNEYGAELGKVDFVMQTDAARKEINDWVANQTNDKIKDLIPSGAVDEMTRLVLANAIYFKGTWSHPFEKEATRPMPFHVSAGAQADVPMMYQKERFRFSRHEDISVIELPYKGDALSMLVLLPAKLDGLAATEKQLTPAKLTEWTAGLAQPEVMVWLPKFTFTSEFKLNEALSKLGMPSAFVPSDADFSGMTGNRDLYISAALHKAFVDVNEEGTEAAAATGMVAGVTSAPLDPPTFRADHPFVFVIRDNGTGSFLFVGRVMDPRGK